MLRPSQGLNERVSLISRNEVKLLKEDDTSLNVEPGHSMPGWNSPKSLKCLAKKRISETNTFYIDSGAGQCLSSCSTAFLTLEPCQIEVVGVVGSLPIFGIGTALFALSMQGGEEVLLRVHNCLYSFGEFNLLSVSQMQTLPRNSLELSIRSPNLRLYASEIDGENQTLKSRKRFIDIPLVLDEGLYALHVKPISPDDSRHLTTQIFDLTPPGDYTPLTQTPLRLVKNEKSTRQIWTTTVVSTERPIGRIFTFAGSLDFHTELVSFSDKFLAPSSVPPSRKQFDVSNASDMSDLSIRFLGVGTDRILNTVGISNGLEKPLVVS
jgi:hypothetical protein